MEKRGRATCVERVKFYLFVMFFLPSRWKAGPKGMVTVSGENSGHILI